MFGAAFAKCGVLVWQPRYFLRGCTVECPGRAAASTIRVLPLASSGTNEAKKEPSKLKKHFLPQNLKPRHVSSRQNNSHFSRF